tara:strand:+ start:3232 stop:5208 length:1977 start_codon:yes stop_codon:yes gene_type:complete
VTVEQKDLANVIRALAMDAVQMANSGHPGMPMGMADVATILFTQFLKYDASNPDWADRDRFILSAGHGSMLLYALLYLTGYPDIDINEIKNFRQLGSKTAGHPEYGHAAGIETTTGPLGQGISTAVGMALAERILASRFSEDIVDHYTYVIAGDGDLMEGISHEAASFAGHLGLSRLIVLYDDNGISIDGSTELAWSDNVPARFDSYGWHTSVVDGHNAEAVTAAIKAARDEDQPSLIACKTTIAYGAPTKAGTAGSHGAPLGDEEIAGVREKISWPYAPFEVPDEIMSVWREAGVRGSGERIAWEKRLESCDSNIRKQFQRAVSGGLPVGWEKSINNIKNEFISNAPNQATRVSSGAVLEKLIADVPELMGGSADLTGSVNTRTSNMISISKNEFDGRYIHYGIREHGMAAVMNGLAQHGGIIPYAGTFLVFADYLRPSLRLSALMRQRVIHVLTHDSIGLGEDGPTHQPVETLASLRAIPNLRVFRPADAVEVAECWELAISCENTPSAIALTRQGVPTVRKNDSGQNYCAKGGYLLSKAESEATVTIMATGSEISVAIKAQEMLACDGITSNVVSLPCWELFDEQTDDYRLTVLGENTFKVAIEAAVSMGWEKYIGPDGIFIGMSSFGASAPAGDLFNHFKITADEVVLAVKKRL